MRLFIKCILLIMAIVVIIGQIYDLFVGFHYFAIIGFPIALVICIINHFIKTK